MTQHHYHERLERDLERLRAGVGQIAADVREGIVNSLRALLTGDRELATQTIIADNPINRAVEDLNKTCHRFVARHLPSAGHLRLITSILRMNVELERVGDYAVTICRQLLSLSAPLTDPLRREIERMGEDALQIYDQAVQAFAQQNTDKARSTMELAKQVDRDFAVGFSTLVDEGERQALSVTDQYCYLIVLNQLERVSDQAKNLCEETVFALTGEIKKRKPVKVLFLDERGSGLAPMAAAIGSKAYPTTGVFASAGRSGDGAIDTRIANFMTSRGHDLDDYEPQILARSSADWKKYDVIISLQGPISDYVEEMPYRTVGLEWDLSPGSYDAEALEGAYRDLTVQLADLMEQLRGSATD